MADYSNIYITNIENETVKNKFFRHVLFTSGNQQLVVMSIKPKEDIPFEIHPNNDQFIRIEKGQGTLLVGPEKKSKYDLSDGIAFIIPANTWHQVINNSETEDLKLYTLYSPPHHPSGKIDVNRPQSGGMCACGKFVPSQSEGMCACGKFVTGRKNNMEKFLKLKNKNFLF